MYGIYDGSSVIARFTAPITVKTNQPTSVSDTLSLKRQAVRRAAQRWEITSGLEPLSYSGQALFVMLVTKGVSETLQALMPQHFGAKAARTSTSTIAVATAAAAGATQVTIKNNTGLIPKGTFIRFGNHSKVYMTTNDVTNNGTFSLYPPLRTAVAVDATIAFKDDVYLNCRFDQETVSGMVFSDGILMDVGTITLLEDV